jgi:hypothetical protein
MTYIKSADSRHGEIGHDGWGWVVDHPHDHDDRAPAFGHRAVLCRGVDGKYRVELDYADHRGEMIDVTVEAVGAAEANRAAYDVKHGITYPIKVIVD